MGVSYFQIICIVLGTALAILWIVLMLMGIGPYKDVVDALDKKKHFFKEFYYIGFRFMDWIHFDMDSTRAHKKIREISELNGSKYATFHYYVLRGGQFVLFLTGTPIVLLFSAIADNSLYLIMFVLMLGIAIYWKEDDYKDKLKKRKQAIVLSFPNVLSKLTLLVNSGMQLRDAIRLVGSTGDGPIYEELQITIEEIDNGTMEMQAYKNFAARCNVREIQKFVSLIIQNFKLGGAELVHLLMDMNEEMWQEKKNQAKKTGDSAKDKLLIPNLIIFVGILIMIIVPMLSKLNF